MTLRVKTMLTVSLTLIGLLLALFLAVKPIVLNGFDRLESQEASATTKTAETAFSAELGGFAASFHGFAACSNLRGMNGSPRTFQRAFESAFTPAVLNALNVNWVVALDPDGHVQDFVTDQGNHRAGPNSGL